MRIAILVMVAVMVVLVGGVLLAGSSLQEKLSGWKPEADRTAVRVQTVGSENLIEFVAAPGEVEPHTKVEISAEVSARIEALPFREGDTVTRGDVIVRLDDEDLKAALESSQARKEGEEFRMRAEQARLQGLISTQSFARKELERKEALYESGDVSRKDLDDAIERLQDLNASVDATNYNISVIESSLAAADADITRAQDGLDNTVIVAPMDGLITQLNMEVGEQVLGTFNNIGSQIMTIADLDRMILKAEVAESDIAAVALGQSAKIHINAYPDDVFVGTVTQIALQRSMSQDGSGIFRVEIEIDLQGRRIYSGLAANVDIEIAQHEGLRVESQAIVDRLVEDLPDEIRRDNPYVESSKRTTSVVYRVVDGEAMCTPVRVGPSDLTHTLVTAGLDESDQVIVGPYKVLEKVEHGELVEDEQEAESDDPSEDAESHQPESPEPASSPDETAADTDDDRAGEAAEGPDG